MKFIAVGNDECVCLVSLRIAMRATLVIHLASSSHTSVDAGVSYEDRFGRPVGRG